MLSLHTNSSALAAQDAINRTQQNLASSRSRLQIKSPSIDSSALSISSRLDLSPQAQALQNNNAAISTLASASHALGEVSTLLQRAKELSQQKASTGANDAATHTTLQNELDGVTGEINRIASQTTDSQGNRLFDGSFQGSQSTVNGHTTSLGAQPDLAKALGSDRGTLQDPDAIDKAMSVVNELKQSVNSEFSRLDKEYTAISGSATDTRSLTSRDRIDEKEEILDIPVSARTQQILQQLEAAQAARQTSAGNSAHVMNLLRS